MSQIKIKTESLPWRCEICHQIDQFEPQRAFCARCANVQIKLETKNRKPTRDPIELAALCGGVSGFCIAFFRFLLEICQQRNSSLPDREILSAFVVLVFAAISLGALTGVMIGSAIHLCIYIYKSLCNFFKRLK